MTDRHSARVRTHQLNLDRYYRLLVTDLTDVEREFLNRRIAEERSELEHLAAAANSDTEMAFIAAQEFAKNDRSAR